ncbi:MAG: hypothetical protein ACI86X_002630 [Moritella sp.]|jgi:hypothetical protein
MENSSYFNSVNGYEYFYPVVQGDTLSQILYNVYGDKTPNEVLRIYRTKAIPATKLITDHVDELGKMSKWASRGGVVLSVAGLGIACSQIAYEEDTHKKNEIFAATPMGWGV